MQIMISIEQSIRKKNSLSASLFSHLYSELLSHSVPLLRTLFIKIFPKVPLQGKTRAVSMKYGLLDWTQR